MTEKKECHISGILLSPLAVGQPVMIQEKKEVHILFNIENIIHEAHNKVIIETAHTIYTLHLELENMAVL